MPIAARGPIVATFAAAFTAPVSGSPPDCWGGVAGRSLAAVTVGFGAAARFGAVRGLARRVDDFVFALAFATRARVAGEGFADAPPRFALRCPGRERGRWLSTPGSSVLSAATPEK